MKLQAKTIFILLFIAFSSTISAQNSFINFYNIPPVPQSISLDRKDILELSNEDIVFTVYDERACSIVRTDEAGNFIWGKKFSGDWVFEPAQVLEMDNEDILVIGRVRNLAKLSREDIALINFSSSGALNWSKRINQPALTSTLTNIVPTIDGNFLITGIHDTSIPGGFYVADGYLAKINSTGELLQSAIFSNRINITFSHVRELENKNVLLFGQTISNQNTNYDDLILILLDANFNKVWAKKIDINDSVSPFQNYSNTPIDFELINNGILISSNVWSASEFYPVILSLDMNVQVNYVKKYTLGGEPLFYPNFIIHNNQEVEIFGKNVTTKLVKLNIADGSLIRSQELLSHDIALEMIQLTKENDYLFKQESQNTATIGKLDPDLSDCLDFQDIDYAATTTNVFIEDMDLTIISGADSIANFDSFTIESFSATPFIYCDEIVSTTYLSPESLVNIAPNPVKDWLMIETDHPQFIQTVEVFSLDGRLMINNQTSGNKLNLVNLANGIYLIRVKYDNEYYVKKIVKY